MALLRPQTLNRITRTFAPLSIWISRPSPIPNRHHLYQTTSFSTTPPSLKKLDFSPKPPEEPQSQRPRKTTTKPSSLHRVAIEAQRSRSPVQHRGSKRFIDPSAPTKTVTAYCAAEQYHIPEVSALLTARGYVIDPFHTGLYPQVIHIQTPLQTGAENGDNNDRGRNEEGGDIFIFPSGTVVTWNVPSPSALTLIHTILPPSAENSHLDMLETEDLEYLEDSGREGSQIIGDTIVLGTKAESASISTSDRNLDAGEPHPSKSPFEQENAQRQEVDTILAKIAFSSGLARSTKLAVLESLLSTYQSSTRHIPTILSGKKPSGGKTPPLTRSFILAKTGELLSIRAQLNLYAELTDSLPDIFWDTHHTLGLEAYYEQAGRALDVGVRIKVLNEKIGFAQEIASVLRETLSEKHGLRLEWAIIALIAVEVVLEVWRWDVFAFGGGEGGENYEKAEGGGV